MIGNGGGGGLERLGKIFGQDQTGPAEPTKGKSAERWKTKQGGRRSESRTETREFPCAAASLPLKRDE